MSTKLINDKFTLNLWKNLYVRMNIKLLELYYSTKDSNVMDFAKCNKVLN